MRGLQSVGDSRKFLWNKDFERMEIHSFKDLSCGKCPRNFEMVLFRIASLAAFLPLLTKSLSNDWGAIGVIVAWADGGSGRRMEGQLEML